MYIGTNFPASAEYSTQLTQLRRGNPDINPFEDMATVGLDFVELSLKQDKFDEASFRADIAELRSYGLKLNIHPYYECKHFGTQRENPRLRPNLRAIISIAGEVSQQQGRPVNLNFHAASSDHQTPRQQLMQHSQNFNAWLMDTVDKLNADVTITTEHQMPLPPNRKWQRVGDNFAELAEMSAALDHSKFGLCWDMGHSTLNTLFYDIDPQPPAEIIARVRHVHIHDVCALPQPKDHEMIGTGEAKLRAHVNDLLEAGYNGGFTMEYDQQEWFGLEYKEALEESKAALFALTKPIVV